MLTFDINTNVFYMVLNLKAYTLTKWQLLQSLAYEVVTVNTLIIKINSSFVIIFSKCSKILTGTESQNGLWSWYLLK